MASYVYGNIVRKENYANVTKKDGQLEQQNRIRNKKQIEENRKIVMTLTTKYVVFLAFAAILSLSACVFYLQLQSTVSGLSSKMTLTQSKLLELKESNAAREGYLNKNTNLIEIRNKATLEFGMCYPKKEQIIEYESGNKDDIIQHYDIPESGVLTELDE